MSIKHLLRPSGIPSDVELLTRAVQLLENVEALATDGFEAGWDEDNPDVVAAFDHAYDELRDASHGANALVSDIQAYLYDNTGRIAV